MTRLWIIRIVAVCYLTVANLAAAHGPVMTLNTGTAKSDTPGIFAMATDCHSIDSMASIDLANKDSKAACQISCAALAFVVLNQPLLILPHRFASDRISSFSAQSSSQFFAVEQHPPKA